MYAIVYKEDRIPMCARLKEAGPDAIVTWDSDTKAKAFLESKGKFIPREGGFQTAANLMCSDHHSS